MGLLSRRGFRGSRPSEIFYISNAKSCILVDSWLRKCAPGTLKNFASKQAVGWSLETLLVTRSDLTAFSNTLSILSGVTWTCVWKTGDIYKLWYKPVKLLVGNCVRCSIINRPIEILFLLQAHFVTLFSRPFWPVTRLFGPRRPSGRGLLSALRASATPCSESWRQSDFKDIDSQSYCSGRNNFAGCNGRRIDPVHRPNNSWSENIKRILWYFTVILHYIILLSCI